MHHPLGQPQDNWFRLQRHTVSTVGTPALSLGHGSLLLLPKRHAGENPYCTVGIRTTFPINALQAGALEMHSLV